MRQSRTSYIYNPIEQFYMNRIHDRIIGYCKKSDAILDFGCGKGYLKKRNKDFKIINYDIVKELSEVEDYTKTNPDVIVCCHVFEHLGENEIKTHLRNFKKMNPKILIVATPIENLLSKGGMFLMGKNSHAGHITTLKEINRIFEEEDFYSFKRKRIFALTEMTIWKIKYTRCYEKDY